MMRTDFPGYGPATVAIRLPCGLRAMVTATTRGTLSVFSSAPVAALRASVPSTEETNHARGVGFVGPTGATAAGGGVCWEQFVLGLRSS
jgi:hypothetical protein